MRVLMVEDDVTLGGAMRDHLIAHGHLVDWVRPTSSAAGASGTLGRDLVLLDLNSPDEMGLNILRALRDAGDVVPVVILTATDQLSLRINGLNAGATDYLSKPFNLGDLTALVAAFEQRDLPAGTHR